MTDDLAVTRTLADLAGTPLPDEVDEALGILSPSLIEWSLNVGDERRGRLRFAAWTDQASRLDATLERLRSTAAQRWNAAVPHDAPGGVGWQLGGAGEPRLRWWQLAPTGDGSALLHSALGYAPDLQPVGEALAAATGSAARCAAVGAELLGDRVERVTLYFEALTPAVAVDLLTRTRVPATPAARTFFMDLCHLAVGAAAAWPKVWAARSVGRTAGWKFYVFMRGDPQRIADEAILSRLEADEVNAGLVERTQWLTGGGQVIQIVGLTFFDEDRGAKPVWTLYLAAK